MKKIIKAILMLLIIVLFIFDITVAAVLAATVYEASQDEIMIEDEFESITGDVWTPQELENAGLTVDSIEIAEGPSHAATDRRLPRY